MPLNVPLWRRYAHSAPWSPMNLRAKVVGFIDFEDNSRITLNGSAISAYSDLISSASYAQATGASQPLKATNAVTGRQVARFDGVASCLEFTGIPTGWPTGANPGEIIAVVTQSAPVSDVVGRRIVMYGGTTATVARAFSRSTGNTAQAVIGTGAASPTSTGAADFSGNHLVRTIVDGTNIYVDQDGALNAATACVPGTTTTRARIGAATAGSASNFWWGDISAIIVTNATLTTAEYNAMAAWARPRKGGA